MPNAFGHPWQEKKDKEWRRIVKTMALLEVLERNSFDALGLYGCVSWAGPGGTKNALPRPL